MTYYEQMRQIKGFRPCPFCEKTDRMLISTEDSLQNQLKDGDGASLSIECIKCGLQVWVHTEKEITYQMIVSMLQKKWNRLAVRDEAIHESA